MSTSEKLVVTEESDETIRFENTADSSRDSIVKLLESFGHLITNDSWVHSQSNRTQLVWCSNSCCHKLFTFSLSTNLETIRGGPNVAPSIGGFWELRRLEVQDNKENLFSRGGIMIIMDREYKISDLKRQIQKHFLCNRYTNLL